MEALERAIERNPSTTLKDLRGLVLSEFQVSVAVTTIKNWLDLELYTVKDVRTLVDRINHPETKKKRAEYMQKFFQARSSGRTMIWADETNFNLYTKRREGRSKIGTRASVVVPTCKGSNLHCIGAMTKDKMIHFTSRRGAFKNADANQWFTELIEKCREDGIDRPTIIVDNAPAHSRLESLLEEFPHVEILRLAPYSYLLNPIELVWSAFKSSIKRGLRDQMQLILSFQRSATETIADRRMQVMENLVQPAMDAVTPVMFTRFALRVERYYTAATLEHDLEEIA